MKFFGYLGSFMLSVCSLPQVVKIVRHRHADGTSLLFLIIWLIGNISMQIYVISSRGLDYPALVSYWVNDIMIGIMLWYKLNPGKTS